MMQSFFLAIEGPIGVGKTTLARLLQPRFDAELLLEAFEENPFLSNFYSDRARYAFQTQMFFLLSRYRQQQSIVSLVARQPLLADYTFAKDKLFAGLNLDGDELAIYQRLYNVLAERVALPDLLIYLRADTDELMARIAARDRPYEREMDRDYIARVQETYERHFANYTRTPLLTFDTDDLNYVQDASALAYVEGRVRRALGIGAYQQSLPQMERAGARELGTAAPEAIYRESDRDLLSIYTSANEAIGQLGVALVARSSLVGGSKEALKRALSDSFRRLRRLADALDVSVEETL